MIKICEDSQCTGCAACVNACNQQAITMAKGLNGHLFPVIDQSLCVDCKLCSTICPNNTTPSFRIPNKAYIATAKDENEAKTSTSSGVASVLSRYILQKGGVVYGCSGVDCENVHHIKVSNEEELWSLKGSKYVQSAINGTYSCVKRDLLNGVKVLFIGTPCQVAGLYAYLRKPFDNLFTVDLVCHGVPSQQILVDALHDYMPNTSLTDICLSFRNKDTGKSQYGLFVKDRQGNPQLCSTFPRNEYITGFLNGLFYRESCYRCHYARPERVSDITLGDYWDHEKKLKITGKKNGMSMIIVNTDKGIILQNGIAEQLNLCEGNCSDFIKRNGQLHHPIKKSVGYEEFASLYPKLGFKTAAKRSLNADYRRIRKNMFLNCLSSVIYSVPGMRWALNTIRNR